MTLQYRFAELLAAKLRLAKSIALHLGSNHAISHSARQCGAVLSTLQSGYKQATKAVCGHSCGCTTAFGAERRAWLACLLLPASLTHEPYNCRGKQDVKHSDLQVGRWALVPIHQVALCLRVSVDQVC